MINIAEEQNNDSPPYQRLSHTGKKDNTNLGRNVGESQMQLNVNYIVTCEFSKEPQITHAGDGGDLIPAEDYRRTKLMKNRARSIERAEKETFSEEVQEMFLARLGDMLVLPLFHPQFYVGFMRSGSFSEESTRLALSPIGPQREPSSMRTALNANQFVQV